LGTDSFFFEEKHLPPPAAATRLTRSGTASEVVKEAEIEGEVLERLKPEHSVFEFAETLLNEEEEDYGSEAMQAIGHSLERKEAVWWAVNCVKAVPELTKEEPAKEALSAAEDWFKDFADNKRRIAFDKAEILGLEEPAALPGAAAFFCQGSIAPSTVEQEILPDAKAVFAMASAAATLAAVTFEPEKARDRYKAFLTLAKEVAEGKNRWKENATPAKPTQATPTATRPATTTGLPVKPPKGGYY
jgi:hypothetical protein